MGQLDASIVTVALPSLRADLHASLAAVEWVSLAYLLVLVGTVSAAGRISDIAGRKLVYTYGFAVFTLSSLGCGLAPSLTVLLLARIAQAVGAAMLQANSVALIRTTATGGMLHRAIGIQGGAQALGLALGPAVGGLLIAVGGWRWVFYVNLPAGVLGLLLGWLLLPRSRLTAPKARLDWSGLATLLPGAGALLVGLSLLGRDGLTYGVLVCAAASLALLLVFLRIQRRASAPLIDLRLFTDRRISRGLSSGLLAYLVLFGLLLVTPLYLQADYRMTAGAAGVLITVLPAALGVSAAVAGMLGGRVGTGRITVIGLILLTAALVAGAGTIGHRGTLIAVLAVAGAGLGMFTAANNAAVAGAGSPHQAGMVSGVLNMTRGVGTSLGVATAGASYALATGAGRGFQVTMLVLAAVAAAAAVLAAGAASRRSELSRALAQ